MKRFPYLIALGVGLAVAVSVFAIASGKSTTPLRGPGEGPGLLLRVDSGSRSHFFHRGAVGLSIETAQLSRRVIDPEAASLVSLMRRLGPATLRIGGNSADRSWWTGDGEPKPGWATNTVTPADLRRLRELLDATGWQAILSVDLGHFEPRRAADEARAAASILGPTLLAIEVGNEPNAFGTSVERLRPSGYGVAAYLSELGVYQAGIRAAAPAVRLEGPDLSFAPSSHTWLPRIAAQRPRPFDELGHHYYPTSFNLPKGSCKRTPVPSAGELLSPQVREYEDVLLGRVVEAGRLAGRPTRISETNTTSSCNAAGGPQTSPVFASALWAFDWSLRATSAGVAAINFHGKFDHCSPYSFSPICAPRTEATPHVVARPEYYGLLAASRLEGGRFVSVSRTGADALDAGITVYATERPDGTVTLALADLSPSGTISVAIDAAGYAGAASRRLIAPSVHARHNASFGGASLDAVELAPPRATPLRQADGLFRLASPAGSAQVITLTPAPG